MTHPAPTGRRRTGVVGMNGTIASITVRAWRPDVAEQSTKKSVITISS